MKYKLTFNKAFGIEFIPLEYYPLFLILKHEKYEVKIKDKKVSKKVSISFGKYGVEEAEKKIISVFYHSHARILSKMPEIPTLNISLEVDLKLPEECSPCDEQVDADSLVEPFIRDALMAVSKFVNSYNCMKHMSIRSKSEWKSQKTYLIPEISESDFKAFLFYKLEGYGQACLGCIHTRRTIHAAELDGERNQLLNKLLATGIPLTRQLLLKSWKSYFQEDYRNTIISTATVAELAISEIIRKKYIDKKIASKEQVEIFLSSTSKRLLCTVILCSLNIGDHKLRDGLKELFVVRNGIVHGKSYNAQKIDAENALGMTEEILKIMEGELN